MGKKCMYFFCKRFYTFPYKKSTCTFCPLRYQTAYVLSALGSIAVGHSNRITIALNDSALTVRLNESTLSFAREATMSRHIGVRAGCWWMSSKFGASSFIAANATFYDVVIIASGFDKDTDAPLLDPSIAPTLEPQQQTLRVVKDQAKSMHIHFEAVDGTNTWALPMPCARGGMDKLLTLNCWSD